MTVQQDFRDLLASLNEHDVEYLIVGAFALAYHGVPRFTGDLDIYVRPTVGNADRVVQALGAFGFRFDELSAADFTNEDLVVQIGRPPVRVDLMTAITGVTWTDARMHAVSASYGDVSVRFLGREQLVANKRATGRKKDLADLEALGEE